MGILFVLPFYMVLASACGTAAGIFFTYWKHRRNPERLLLYRDRPLSIAVLSLAMFIYSLLVFVAFAIDCEHREVDAVIGDYWQVPLGNGYYFVMVDRPDYGTIKPGADRFFDSPNQITSLAQDGDMLAGQASQGPFTVNLAQGKTRYYPSMEAALAAMPGRVELQSPQRFYWGRRGIRADLYVILPAAGMALVIIYAWWRLASHRSRRRQSVSMPSLGH